MIRIQMQRDSNRRYSSYIEEKWSNFVNRTHRYTYTYICIYIYIYINTHLYVFYSTLKLPWEFTLGTFKSAGRKKFLGISACNEVKRVSNSRTLFAYQNSHIFVHEGKLPWKILVWSKAVLHGSWGNKERFHEIL